MVLSPGFVQEGCWGRWLNCRLAPAIRSLGIGGRPYWLRRVDQHQFGILQRRDVDLRLIADGEAVTRVDVDAVDFDLAGGGYEVEMARLVRGVMRALARLQRGGQHACIRTDRQRVLVVRLSAGNGNELAGAVRFGKRLGSPGRRAAICRWLDPDLENLGRPRLQIVFGVTNARSGAHHLNVAGFGAALVAETVLMRDRAFPHIGDDFHVGVGMSGKAGVRRDLVIVPDAKRTEAHIAGIVVAAEWEGVFVTLPPVSESAQPGEGA